MPWVWVLIIVVVVCVAVKVVLGIRDLIDWIIEERRLAKQEKMRRAQRRHQRSTAASMKPPSLNDLWKQ